MQSQYNSLKESCIDLFLLSTIFYVVLVDLAQQQTACKVINDKNYNLFTLKIVLNRTNNDDDDNDKK